MSEETAEDIPKTKATTKVVKKTRKLVRPRSKKWTFQEKKLLKDIVHDQLHIIDSRKQDGNSIKQRKNAWLLIEKRFNDLNKRERLLSDLKTQWNQLKKIIKDGSFHEELEDMKDERLVLDLNEEELMMPKGQIDVEEELGGEPLQVPEQRRNSSESSHQEYESVNSTTEDPSFQNKCIQQEHYLRIKCMQEAHEWAYKEHKMRIENLRLENQILARKLERETVIESQPIHNHGGYKLEMEALREPQPVLNHVGFNGDANSIQSNSTFTNLD